MVSGTSKASEARRCLAVDPMKGNVIELISSIVMSSLSSMQR